VDWSERTEERIAKNKARPATRRCEATGTQPMEKKRGVEKPNNTEDKQIKKSGELSGGFKRGGGGTKTQKLD